ncbi:MAG: TRM11 family SAM-dependent methyltransferase [Stackebrandtia sp.]
MLDLDRAVTDRLLLRTVPGAVDYLFEELRTIPEVTVVSRRPDGLVVDVDGSLRPLAEVRYFTSAGVLPGDDVLAGLRASAADGAVSALDEPVRFRVGDVGDGRWTLRDELVARGWRNEPGDWDVNIEAGPLAEVGSLHWTKRFGSLLRAPASTNPVIASVMVRLAKIEAGQTVLDPMCGAGTLLATAEAMASGARLLGSDHDRRWVRATRDNIAAAAKLWRGDARKLPLADGSVDRMVANLPFGKRVGSHTGNKTLYPAVLGELARVLTAKGRAVLLTEDKRLFTETVQRTRGLRVIKEITFSSGGAHPSAYVVTTRRTR